MIIHSAEILSLVFSGSKYMCIVGGCWGPGCYMYSQVTEKALPKSAETMYTIVPYLLDQTPLSISRRSRIVAAPPDVLSEIVAALEY